MHMFDQLQVRDLCLVRDLCQVRDLYQVHVHCSQLCVRIYHPQFQFFVQGGHRSSRLNHRQNTLSMLMTDMFISYIK